MSTLRLQRLWGTIAVFIHDTEATGDDMLYLAARSAMLALGQP
jgi:hypothetical protein